MYRIDDVIGKLNVARRALDEIIDGVSPIISDFHNIRSSDDQYECIDFPWASEASDGAKEIYRKIDELVDHLLEM